MRDLAEIPLASRFSSYGCTQCWRSILRQNASFLSAERSLMTSNGPGRQPPTARDQDGGGRRESGGRCSRQPRGGVTGNVLRQTLTVIPNHLRNVAPLLLDPDHSDADLRRMMISRTFGMSALSSTFGMSARSDVFKTECHSCGVLSEPNEPATRVNCRHITRAFSCGTRSPIVAPPPKRPGE
jgi:hypothetical protein